MNQDREILINCLRFKQRLKRNVLQEKISCFIGYKKGKLNNTVQYIINDFFNYDVDGKLDHSDATTRNGLVNDMNDINTHTLMIYSHHRVNIKTNGERRNHDI